MGKYEHLYLGNDFNYNKTIDLMIREKNNTMRREILPKLDIIKAYYDPTSFVKQLWNIKELRELKEKTKSIKLNNIIDRNIAYIKNDKKKHPILCDSIRIMIASIFPVWALYGRAR